MSRISVSSSRSRSLGYDALDDSRSFLSQQACLDLCHRIERATNGRGATGVRIASTWRSSIKWARNRAMLLDDVQDHSLFIQRFASVDRSGEARVQMNQIDDTSLRSAVQSAESNIRSGPNGPPPFTFTEPDYVYPTTAIWSDRTYAQTAEDRIAIVRDLTDVAEQAGMLSAGDISVSAVGNGNHLTGLRMLYAPMTRTECSITVRDPDGTGSGWAGRSSYDWYRFDARALAAVAVDKCLRSRNPVRIEPGRYTTILEPQATYDFVIPGIWGSWANGTDTFYWESSQAGQPYYEEPEIVETSSVDGVQKFVVANTKIGQQLTDKRFTLSYSPDDPDLGVLPWAARKNGRGPVRAATWFNRGMLAQLEYETSVYREGTNGGWAYRMEGGPTSIAEMIETTKRGLLVTRFDDVGLVDLSSLLYNGLTRDGLWLIENGKITKAVKNLRFTESPLLALNNLEQIGPSVPVFSPRVPAVVPPIKVRDFSFTALTDAV